MREDDVRDNSSSDGFDLDVLYRKNTDKMGRRAFTKTLITAGFGGTALSAISKSDVAAAASDQVPIPVKFNEDETALALA